MSNTSATERSERDKGIKWFHNLSSTSKWLLGDQFVLGDFDWRDWFDYRPSKAFLDGAEYARILWEMSGSK